MEDTTSNQELDQQPVEAAPEVPATDAPEAPVEAQETPSSEPQEASENSLRDTIKEAFKQSEPKDEKPEKPRAQDGKYVKAEQAAAAKAQELSKAPESWRPEVREHWAKVPDAVKAEIYKRESEMARGVQKIMGEAGSAMNAIGAMRELMSPYSQLLHGRYGGDAARMMSGYMQTESNLLMGTAPEVANVIAGMIQQYGVGRFGKQFIEALDSTLVGEQVQARPEDIIQRTVQQQLAPILQTVQQRQWQEEQQIANQVQGGIQEIAQKGEFFNDVRLDMADIIDMATARGETISLIDAYKKACWQNEGIRNILLSRSQQNTAQQRGDAAQRAKAAAVGIHGGPAPGAISNNSNMSLRDTIAAAIDSAEGRV